MEVVRVGEKGGTTSGRGAAGGHGRIARGARMGGGRRRAGRKMARSRVLSTYLNTERGA